MYGQPYYGNPTMQQPVQPIFMGPPVMPPPAPSPTIIVVQKKEEAKITNMAQIGDISFCQYCNQQTNNIINKKVGCVTIAWCFFLLFTTVGLFWIPFCCDGCKDSDFTCQRCCNPKTTVQANCC